MALGQEMEWGFWYLKDVISLPPGASWQLMDKWNVADICGPLLCRYYRRNTFEGKTQFQLKMRGSQDEIHNLLPGLLLTELNFTPTVPRGRYDKRSNTVQNKTHRN